MKLKYCLGLSLILNLVLILFLLSGRHPQPTSPMTAPPSADTAAAPPSATGHPREAPPAKTHSTTPGDWVQALRQAGVPEKVIADVAAADFENRWQKRMGDLRKKFDRGEIDEAALTRFDLEHDGEQEKDLRAALGDEGFRHWDEAKVLADFDRAGLELTASESDELYALRKEQDRKRLELDRARQQGQADQDDTAGETLYAQYQEQLLKLLGDDRYAQLQSGGDTGLGALRRGLRQMNADDTQVAGVETAQQTWNSQRGKLELQLQKGQMTAEEFEQRMKTLDAERDRAYEKQLGAEGVAEFQKTQDPRYQAMLRSGPGWGLADNDINNLYATIQNYENNVRDYRERAQAIEQQGQAVDWAAVEKSLKEFSQQTENALRASLGDKFDKLKHSNLMPFER